MINLGTKYLESERLIYRKLEISDFDEFYRLLQNDKRVIKYFIMQYQDNKEKALEAFMKLTSQYEDERCYRWAICDRNNNFIGLVLCCGLNDMFHSAELGYCLGHEYWGNGYATEALERIIKFFFEEVGVNRITAEHIDENPASGRVMQKAGMIYETVAKEEIYYNDKYYDSVHYRILKSEYENNKTGK